MSISTWQNSTSSHHSSRRPGVCCRSSRRRGWDRSSSVAQSNPAPGVLSAASDRRDTYSPGLVSAGTTCTGHDGMPADTGGLHSLASWKEQLNTRGCDRSKIKALDGQNQCWRVGLTSHIFFHRRNVPNHQILLYLCHTGLPVRSRHKSKLPIKTAKEFITFIMFHKLNSAIHLHQSETHPAELAAGMADRSRCGTPAHRCVQHSWVQHHTLCHIGAQWPDRSALVDLRDII